jgi:hypothetical protein
MFVVDFDNCLGLSQSNLTTSFSIRRKILLCLETNRRDGRMVRRGRRGMWKERNVQHDDRPENRGVKVCETCM